MEEESFEDKEVAALMNEHFVSIKVDREEGPDVDDVYMTACQLTSEGGCGWPLNAFALPDGRPIWAGTYFPKENWKTHPFKTVDSYSKWSEGNFCLSCALLLVIHKNNSDESTDT